LFGVLVRRVAAGDRRRELAVHVRDGLRDALAEPGIPFVPELDCLELARGRP